MTILAVSAHPDDIDFICAGTIAKLVQEGNTVHELIVSDGSKGSHVVGFGAKKLLLLREREQQAAAKALGAGPVHFLRETDGEVENTKALRKKLVRIFRTIRPDVVMSFDPASLMQFMRPAASHRDHRQTAEAVFDALYPATGNRSFFPELLAKGPVPHQIQELWLFGSHTPHYYVNITATMVRKKAALQCHVSQIADMKQAMQWVEKRAREIGVKKRIKYAEAFRVLRLA